MNELPVPLRELHLFAGCGGGILGGMLLGHTTVCAVEIEPYCQRVLLQRQSDGILPGFPIWGDVQTFDGAPWRGKADIVAAGFPCTDVSVAGRKWEHVTGDITGDRSGLWGEVERVVSEVRPQFVFVENSPALVGAGLALVISDLAALGYDCRWCVIGADITGYPHHRARVWLLAYPMHEPVPGDQQRPIQRVCGISRDELGRRIADLRNGPPTSELFYRGKSDGVPNYMDRYKAAGNAQVPAVAALAWRLLGGPQ